jgi:hypothetical protein
MKIVPYKPHSDGIEFSPADFEKGINVVLDKIVTGGWSAYIAEAVGHEGTVEGGTIIWVPNIAPDKLFPALKGRRS